MMELLPTLIIAGALAVGLGTALVKFVRTMRRFNEEVARVATACGITDLKPGKLSRIHLKGRWNDMPVILNVYPPGHSSYSAYNMTLLVLEVKTDLQGRFYLRNRPRPLITNSMVRHARFMILPPEATLQNDQDQHLFAAHTKTPEVVEPLLSSPTTRSHLIKNLVDNDGEIVLEGGVLRVIRLSRINMRPNDPSSVGEIERMLQEAWDLVRSSVAVLQPMKMQISDRESIMLGCPFCRSELTELSSCVQCSQCRTFHHEACWTEHGRCNVYGCAGFPVPIRKEARPVSTQQS